MHKEWEELQTHEVVGIEKVEGDVIRLVSPKKAVPLRCSKHDKKLKLYCDTCGELICHHCTVHTHKEHNYCVIIDAFNTHKEEILSSLEPVKAQLEATNHALTSLEVQREEIATQRAALECDIHTSFQQAHKILEDREAQLIAQLENQTQQKLKNVTAQRDEVEVMQTQRSSCLHFVSESIRTGTQGDVMKMKKKIVNQVKELTDNFNSETLDMKETANLCFKASPDVLQSCQQFGRDLP